ncbi:uncharacterized protein [Lolium perenne]|uniref:uncharacterized protein n=1 Tax=Lolium perenne TaxID=4522 RepID=UPI0021F55FCE|nr:uncharacterized protein LOC127316063 [Lolium perenne]
MAQPDVPHTGRPYVRRSRLFRLHGLHRRFAFAVIAKDITDNIANDSDLRRVVHAMVLDQYCASSGQLVSQAKCSIFFNPNVDVDIRAAICVELNIMTEAICDRYLGLPALVGADRSDKFLYLLEKIIKRLEGWKEKFLSMGGKEILLKAIIQSIPVYAMSVFNLPKKLCKEITDAMAAFWWGDTEEKKKMHWMAWWKLCVPKRTGGISLSLHNAQFVLKDQRIFFI